MDSILYTKQIGSYRSTVWPNRWWAGIWTIIEFQIVVLAISRVINVNLVECNFYNSSTGSPNTPFTVSAIWIGTRVIWTGKGPMVSIQPASTTWGGKYRKLNLLVIRFRISDSLVEKCYCKLLVEEHFRLLVLLYHTD